MDPNAADLRQFITHLLHHLDAFEAMIAGGSIESGVRRIGAEQELFLVDRVGGPRPWRWRSSQRSTTDISPPNWAASIWRSISIRWSSEAVA